MLGAATRRWSWRSQPRAALHRADAIHWTSAVFTNLTQDHLDFHAGMEDYFLAKRRLFEAGPRAVINVDDPYGARLAAEFPHAIRIGLDAPRAQVRATGIEGDARGSSFAVDGLRLRTTMPGRFNVLNALAAVVVARELGVDEATIAAALAACERVPGRFEAVDEGQPRRRRRLLAHAGLARNALRAARELAEGRVIAVFGAGGDRDRAKRPLMGAAARRGRRRDRHLRQPAQRGSRGDHRRERRCARRRSSASPIAARRSSEPSRSPRRAT